MVLLLPKPRLVHSPSGGATEVTRVEPRIKLQARWHDEVDVTAGMEELTAGAVSPEECIDLSGKYHRRSDDVVWTLTQIGSSGEASGADTNLWHYSQTVSSVLATKPDEQRFLTRSIRGEKGAFAVILSNEGATQSSHIEVDAIGMAAQGFSGNSSGDCSSVWHFSYVVSGNVVSVQSKRSIQTGKITGPKGSYVIWLSDGDSFAQLPSSAPPETHVHHDITEARAGSELSSTSPQ